MGGTALSRVILIGLLAAVLYVASLVVLPVERVVVTGNHHLSRAEVLAAVGVYPGDPWIWATRAHIKDLLENPWVASAELQRPRVGEVVIAIEERHPVATLQTPSGTFGVAADGTLLPGAPPTEPLITGFGGDRLREALQIAALLPGVKKINYDPTGFTVDWKGKRLWIQNLDGLQVWRSRVDKMQGKDIAIYTWGVSIRQ
ncbi:cell division protein FtsQ/DivIB [Oceanithermus sp.]